jgi:hypothetical protein
MSSSFQETRWISLLNDPDHVVDELRNTSQLPNKCFQASGTFRPKQSKIKLDIHEQRLNASRKETLSGKEVEAAGTTSFKDGNLNQVR